MRIKISACLAFVILFFLYGNVAAQDNWKLNTEKEGIKVYTSEVANSKFRAIKVTCLLDASLSQVVAALMDVKASPEWLYHVKSASLVKSVSEAELYYHCEVSLPFPLDNRDFVAHLTVRQDPATRIVIIDGPTVVGYVPIKKGVVRVTDSDGKWQLLPEGEKVRLVYTLHTDPGGSLPAWLVNLFATDGPLKSIRNLKEQLKKPAYAHTTYSFIRN